MPKQLSKITPTHFPLSVSTTIHPFLLSPPSVSQHSIHFISHTQFLASRHTTMSRKLLETMFVNARREETPLHSAVSRNDIAKATILLKKASREGKLRELVDKQTRNTGDTALHLAARVVDPNFRRLMDASSYAMAVLLLTYEAKFDVRNDNGYPPVDLGPGRHISFVRLLKAIELHFKLIKLGAGSAALETLKDRSVEEFVCATNCRDSRGCTMLQAALTMGRRETILLLLKMRSEKSSGFLVNDDQIDVLDQLDSRVKALAISLKNRLEIVLKSSDRSQIYEEAGNVLSDAKDIVNAVRRYEREINLESIGNLDVRSITESVEYLEEAYRGMLIEDPKAFARLAMLAVYLPVQFVEEAICEAVLMDAVKRGQLERVERCLDGNPKMVEKLRRPAKISDKGDNMPLDFFALMNLRPEVAQPLIKNCAVPTVKSYMALHLAAKNNHLDVVKCLLKHGAVYCARDNDGKTPEELASDERVTEFFKMIERLFSLARDGNAELPTQLGKLKSDADLLAVTNARDEEGFTLNNIAAKHERIAQDLLQIVNKADNSVQKND